VSLRLKREALDRDVNVDSMATALPTSKTAQVALYVDHARASLAAFHVVFRHYKDERPTRWKTYCREQKALHDICMRIKGKKRAKKEDVVVAYRDGLFGSTMRGKGLCRLRSCASTFAGTSLSCRSTSSGRVESAPRTTG
ncbi:hypothetical protein V1506DRAFT_509349, partial [Lipomyces tetrasporus]